MNVDELKEVLQEVPAESEISFWLTRPDGSMQRVNLVLDEVGANGDGDCFFFIRYTDLAEVQK